MWLSSITERVLTLAHVFSYHRTFLTSPRVFSFFVNITNIVELKFHEIIKKLIKNYQNYRLQ